MNKIRYNVLKRGKVVDQSWCFDYQFKGIKEGLKRYKLKVKVIAIESRNLEMEI